MAKTRRGKDKEVSGQKPAAGKGASVVGAVAKDFGDVAKNLPSSVFSPPIFDEAKPAVPEKPLFRMRDPKEEDALKAISNKISKRAFESILRFVYVDDKDDFTDTNINAVMGALRYLGDQNLNSLGPNRKTLTTKYAAAKYLLFLRKRRLARRKRMLLINYIRREMPRPIMALWFEGPLKAAIMCTEEIATLFHPPLEFVKSVKTQIIPSRKGQAPMDLPTKERT